MRVVQPKPELPVERKTLIEMSDREIAVVERALYRDDPSATKLQNENFDAFTFFNALRNRLGIEEIGTAK